MEGAARGVRQDGEELLEVGGVHGEGDVVRALGAEREHGDALARGGARARVGGRPRPRPRQRARAELELGLGVAGLVAPRLVPGEAPQPRAEAVAPEAGVWK